VGTGNWSCDSAHFCVETKPTRTFVSAWFFEYALCAAFRPRRWPLWPLLDAHVGQRHQLLPVRDAVLLTVLSQKCPSLRSPPSTALVTIVPPTTSTRLQHALRVQLRGSWASGLLNQRRSHLAAAAKVVGAFPKLGVSCSVRVRPSSLI